MGESRNLKEARERIRLLEAALAGMLTIEAQDNGHIHTINMRYRARDLLGIPEGTPIGLWMAQRKTEA